MTIEDVQAKFGFAEGDDNEAFIRGIITDLYTNSSIFREKIESWAAGWVIEIVQGSLFSFPGGQTITYNLPWLDGFRYLADDGTIHSMSYTRAFVHELVHLLYNKDDGITGHENLSSLSMLGADYVGGVLPIENDIMRQMGDTVDRISYPNTVRSDFSPPSGISYTDGQEVQLIISDSGYGLDAINVADRTDDTLLLGAAGNDLIIGGKGTDFIHGGTGNDTITSGIGDDYVIGGAGDDHVAADIIFSPNDPSEPPSWALLTDYVKDYLAGGEGIDIYYAGLSVTMAIQELSLDNFEVFEKFSIRAGTYPNYTFNQNVWENIDVISDSDGQGAILYSMVFLEAGGSEKGAFGGEIDYTAVWHDAIMPFYRLMKSDDLGGTSFGNFVIQPYLDSETGISSDRLVFFSSEMSVAMFAIENFVNGDFGVTIPGYVGNREGGDGDDYIAPPRPAPAPENLDGKAGEDTADYSAKTAAVEINLETGQGAYGAAIVNVENIIATAYDDSLTGNTADNELHGLAGDDTFVGSEGSDLIDGGDDVDEVVFSGDEAEFQISLTPSGQVQVQGTTSTTLLSNIEFVQFDDQRIDTSSLGGPEGGWSASDDRFWTDANTPIIVDILANDDIPSEVQANDVNPYIWWQPQHGTIAWNGTGYTYTPDTGFTGTDWFHYGLHDGANGDEPMADAFAIVHVGQTYDPNDQTGITDDGIGGTYGTYFGGSSFNDSIAFGGGTDNFADGRGGSDRIVFEGDADDYEIAGEGSNFVITNIVTGEMVRFTSFEYIRFDDGVDISLASIVANSGYQPGAYWFEPEPIGGLV